MTFWGIQSHKVTPLGACTPTAVDANGLCYYLGRWFGNATRTWHNGIDPRNRDSIGIHVVADETINPYASPGLVEAGEEIDSNLNATGVACEVTDDDLEAWMLYVLFDSPRMRFGRTIFASLVGIAIIATPIVLWISGVRHWAIAVPLLLGTMLLGASHYSKRYAAREQVWSIFGKTSGDATGSMRYEISASGIYRRSTLSETKYAWAAIDRIRRGKHHLFIALSPRVALVLPYRDFDDDGHRMAFTAMCEQFFDAANH